MKELEKKNLFKSQFLPHSKEEMQNHEWENCDFIFVSADAYVDHPSFATALLGRLLESKGYRVCILDQPDINNPQAFTIFGRPNLGFLVSGGAMDSMVANYTANNKPRSEDSYSPAGKKGKRPDRAIITYVNLIRQNFKNIPIIIGGIEASLRRFSHYDYWSNTIKHSLLLDSKADLLLYGMGEHSILKLAQELKKGTPIKEIRDIPGSSYRISKKEEIPENSVIIPSFEEVKFAAGNTGTEEEIKFSRESFCKAFVLQEENSDAFSGKTLVEQNQNQWVVQNPASKPLTQEEFDKIYELPFNRACHPDYEKDGGIPALKEVQFSLTSCRGCFGACSFCAITFHQGRIIQARSHKSLIKEAKDLTTLPDFKGYIHDVGGPTANFRQPACDKQLKQGACKNRQCLGTDPCPNIKVDHSDFIQLLKEIRQIPKIKKVFIRSGLRFDYIMKDKNKEFLKELCLHHISGQLKVAPEHVSDNVLSLMRKSTHNVYESFRKAYTEENNSLGCKQYLIPYFISSHPGATLEDALKTALYLKETGFVPDQIQDFYPTPGSLSTVMYCTELNPYNLEPIFVAKKKHDRDLQRALTQFNHPQNYDLVKEALILLNRKDLIGMTAKCLIRPYPQKNFDKKKVHKNN